METSRPALTLTDRPRYIVNGEVITAVRSRKVWEILGHIVFSEGHIVDRDQVATKVWPDRSRYDALRNLRQTILHVHRYLPESKKWFVVTRSTMAIRPGRVDLAVDRDAFLAKFLPHLHLEPDSAPPTVDSEDSSYFFPYRRLDIETRRSALVGLTPGLINLGHFKEGIEEIANIRAIKEWRHDVALSLAEAELRIAAKQISEAKAVLDEVRDHPQFKLPKYRTRLLAQDSSCCFHDGDYAKARSLALDVLKVNAELGGYRLVGRAFNQAIGCSVFLGDMASAQKILKKAKKLEYRGASGHWNLIFEFLDLYFGIEANPREPEHQRLNALQDELLKDSQSGIVGVYIARVGYLFLRSGDEAQAERLYNLSLSRLSGTDCLQETAEAHSYLGDLHGRQGNHAAELASHLVAVNLRRPLSSPLGLATSLRGAGVAAYELGMGEQAGGYFNEAEAIFRSIHNPFGLVSTQIAAARNLRKMGRNSDAREMYLVGLSQLEEAYKITPQNVRPAEFASSELIKAEFAAFQSN